MAVNPVAINNNTLIAQYSKAQLRQLCTVSNQPWTQSNTNPMLRASLVGLTNLAQTIQTLSTNAYVYRGQLINGGVHICVTNDFGKTDGVVCWAIPGCGHNIQLTSVINNVTNQASLFP